MQKGLNGQFSDMAKNKSNKGGGKRIPYPPPLEVKKSCANNASPNSRRSQFLSRLNSRRREMLIKGLGVAKKDRDTTLIAIDIDKYKPRTSSRRRTKIQAYVPEDSDASK